MKVNILRYKGAITLSFLAVSSISWVGLHVIKPFFLPHLYNLDCENLFRVQFQSYILTHDCSHFTFEIASHLESVLLLPDVSDSFNCQRINQTQLHLNIALDDNENARYRNKYIQALEHCAHEEKSKCFILGEESVFKNTLRHTLEVILPKTITLFGHDTDTYHCGNQCRIYPKTASTCISQCVQTSNTSFYSSLDSQLEDCQSQCGLEQKNIMLTKKILPFTKKHCA